MDLSQLSYMVRYVLVFLIFAFALLLTLHAILELRWNMQKSVLPSRGFFLIASDCINTAAECRSFSIFHTTIIGRSSSCDIRIKSRLVAKRHAVLYFFDNAWYVRPGSTHFPLYFNGAEIHDPVHITNRDILGIGDAMFTFVDERKEADDASIQFAYSNAIPVYPKSKSFLHIGGAYICMNGFMIVSTLLFLYFVSDADKAFARSIRLSFFIFFAISNLYYLLLPVIMKNLDRVLLLVMIELSYIGLLVQLRLQIFSSSGIIDNDISVLKELNSQVISLCFGFLILPIICIIVSKTGMLEKMGKICAVLTPLFFIITFIFGNGMDSHGATLWIQIAGNSLQLTEFAKVSYLIVLASFFKNRASRKNQLIFAGWAAFVFLLIMMLPDLGSAMILLPTTLVVYVVMTSEYITTLLILVAGSAVGAVAFALFDHVRRRILGWTSLWTDVNDNNRQIVYSLQAVARGGLFGRGVGNGSPSGIPLASSDMVFAIICEELGILTGICIVLIFIVIWLRSARITILSHDGFSSSLALAIGSMLFVEAVVVISGVTGLFPLTGATLPLIARGGSSVLTVMVLFALLLGLSARGERRGELR